MNSAQVPSVHRGATGRRAVVVGGKRDEGGFTWVYVVFRRTHGLCYFCMIRTARPGAMVAMGQRYNDHFRSSHAPTSMPEGSGSDFDHEGSEKKVGCQG